MTHARSTLAAVLLFALPLSASAGWKEGVAAYREGRYAAAEAAFREVVSARPERSEGHYMLGLSLLGQDRAAEAAAALRAGAELAPEDVAMRLALARALVGAGERKEALELLPGLRVGEEERAVWVQLLAAAAAGGGEVAESALAEAIEAAPRESGLQVAMAKATSDPVRSFRAAARAAELDPANGEVARWAVGKAFALARDAAPDDKLARYEAAVAIARAWHAASPSVEGRQLLGQALMGARHYDEAAKELRRAVEEGGGATARFELARCKLAAGDAGAALGDLDGLLAETLETDLRRSIQIERGKTLRHLERFDEAAAAYRSAGDEERAEKMVLLASAQRGNLRWAEEAAACRRRLSDLDELERESQGLEGTAVWRELQEARSRASRECASYLEELRPSAD